MHFTKRSSTYSIVQEQTFGSAASGLSKLITSAVGLGTSTAVLSANITGIAVGDIVYAFDKVNQNVKYTARVVAVAAGVSVTVDDSNNTLGNAGLVANTSWEVQGTVLKIGDKTKFLELTEFNITPQVANITRNVIRQSFVSLESLVGEKTSSGSIALEVTPLESDIAGINGGILYENTFGKVFTGDTVLIPKTTTIDGLTSTPTNLVVLDTTTFTAGQVIKVGSEYTTIKTITNATEMVVRPALVLAPADLAVVSALHTYILAGVNDPQYTLSVREHIGNTYDYVYSGVISNSVSISIPTANIPISTFSVTGAGFSGGLNTAVDTTPSFSQIPFIGKNATVTVGGVVYCMRDVKIDVGSEVYDSKGICSDGISGRTVVSKPTLKLSGTLDYTNMDNFLAFQKGDTGEMWISMVNQDGKALVFYAPRVKRTNVTKGDDSMVITESIELEMLESGEVEYTDAIMMGIGR